MIEKNLDIKARVQGIKAKYSKAGYVTEIKDNLRPGGVFAVGRELWVVDFATDSIRAYSVPGIQYERSFDLSGEGIEWSFGYNETANLMYVMTKKKNLVLLDREFRPQGSYAMETGRGIFFQQGEARYFIPGLVAPQTVYILNKDRKEEAGIRIQPSAKETDTLPTIFSVEGQPVGYYYKSKEVLFLEDNVFAVKARLEELPGQLNKLLYLEKCKLYAALSSNSGDSNHSEIYLYDRNLQFLRRIPLENTPASGGLCIIDNSLTCISSFHEKYVKIFTLDYEASGTSK